MWEALVSWVTVSIVVTVLIGIGVGVLSMAPPHYIIAQFCFSFAGLLLLSRTAWWIAFEQSANTNAWQRGLFVVVVFGAIGFIWLRSVEWVQGLPQNSGAKSSQQEDHKAATPFTPSLVFVFGAPLGDNASASWVMLLKHYGPSPAYNCDIGFFDDDRKNIEYEWLTRHPDSPYPPPGLTGESQKLIHLDEASTEGAPGNFIWTPVNPNSQHYTVSINCRDGVFVEKWEVTRVNGVLRSRITIEHGAQWVEKNPNLDPVVFRYGDPEFVGTALATEMPKTSKGKVVHPGWKPKYRFEVPAAIIDPNDNVQILFGVKLPDGSTQTDFGSWNILTRHFGDNEAPSKKP